MAEHGELTEIDEVVYGAPDLDLARRLFDDWGLEKNTDSHTQLVYRTGDGGLVTVRHEGSSELPPPLPGGGHFREVIWCVASQSALERVEKELARDRRVRTDASGTIHAVDDFGINIGFRVRVRAQTPLPAGSGVDFNTPWSRQRLDERAPIYERAHPWRIGHIGFRVDDVDAAERFYRERLGFWLSDRYAEGGASFLRHAARADHHTLYMNISPNGQTSLHHVAFEVRDIHEVFGGGLAFSRKGWGTQAGPGRHPVSSAYFWYFKNPLGGAIEYFSDTDVVTEDWKPVDFPEARFSEWHMPDGLKQDEHAPMRSSVDIARERKASKARG